MDALLSTAMVEFTTMVTTLIAAKTTEIVAAGFTTTLWTLPYAVPRGERIAFAAPELPQTLAALEVFAYLFVPHIAVAWVHLAAEMQAGKTGVVTALIRLVMANAVLLRFSPDRIFVITGMSDDDWKEQTDDRVPAAFRENVHHGGTLAQVALKLRRLAEGETLRDVLIFIDESHFATSSSNRPSRLVYEEVARLCPRELWVANNIRFVTISATDPAKVLAQKESNTPAKTIRLLTSPLYQSVGKLRTTGRIKFLEEQPGGGVLHTPEGFAAFAEEVRALERIHGPRVHILRPNRGKTSQVLALCEREFPGCRAVVMDMHFKKQRRADDSSSSSSTGINELYLNTNPTATTFILLKDKFRAAKTLTDTYVGIFYDRVGAKDDTNLQSLLGRACGYKKSTTTIVFTSCTSVMNYLRHWREMCGSLESPTQGTRNEMALLSGRMAGVGTRLVGDDVRLVPTITHSSPLGAGVGAAPAGEGGLRSKHNDDDYEVHWSEEFASVAELKAAKLTIGKTPKPNADGFYKNANTGKGKMSRDQLNGLKHGKKTTNMRDELEVGKTSKRTYPFYEDTTDASTLRFVVRTLTRVK